MSKKKLTIIIIVGVILIAFLSVRNCRLSPNINRLQGEINLRDTQLDEARAELDIADKRLAWEQKINDERQAELSGEIDSSNTVIAKLEMDDATKAKRIGELEALHPESPEEEINNLRERTELMKMRLSSFQLVIVEKDKIIFSLKSKYEAELKLRTQVEGLLGGYKSQVSLLETHRQTTASLVAKLERKLRLSKVMKTGATLAFVGTVAYLLLKSK